MPQPPSPSMGIIWPSDKDDNNQWDVIMDTAIRVVVDGHNHAAGNGAKVAISQLAYDADISFVDAGGGKHAITNMKAIAFFPVPTTDVTALAGAFFLNTADNELYFRTVTGVNIQFTNVGALNVGAFAGTIGGDYVGVAALEIFDDATDAYWFQQQVGGAVRQYAKMRSADLSLFEFKVVGASPVPVQAVTLKSPAALAAGYTLTFPGALPGATQVLTVDNTGALAVDGNLDLTLAANRNIAISGTGVYKHGDVILTLNGMLCFGQPGAFVVNTGNDYLNVVANGSAFLPIPLKVGDRIKSITYLIFGDGVTDVAVTVNSVSAAMAQTSIGTLTTNNQPGSWSAIALAVTNTTLVANASICVEFAVSSFSTTFRIGNISVTYDHP